MKKHITKQKQKKGKFGVVMSKGLPRNMTPGFWPQHKWKPLSIRVVTLMKHYSRSRSTCSKCSGIGLAKICVAKVPPRVSKNVKLPKKGALMKKPKVLTSFGCVSGWHELLFSVHVCIFHAMMAMSS